MSMLQELNGRAREVLRQIVESYVETGEPVGSRHLSRCLEPTLSPATIRNVMADLEELGLLFSPHMSAGRLPTETGLRLFVDGLLELGNLSPEERENIDDHCQAAGASVEAMLSEATEALSGLSQCAGLVSAPKSERPFRHIEFVNLSPGRTLVIMVTETGMVENRLLATPADLPASALVSAANYLNARLAGGTLGEAKATIERELQAHRTQLDELTQRVVEDGVAIWSGDSSQASLIVRGQANLIDDLSQGDDLERIRALFQALETKEELLHLLGRAQEADGVQIFIGAENPLFGLSECSMVIAPYRDSDAQFVGAIGVVGPTRLNYARIIPMVDYTAQVIGKLLSGSTVTPMTRKHG
jgi:heat-inducible transcriptional repressor